MIAKRSYFDLRVQSNFLGIVVFVIEWIHANLVEVELLSDALLEDGPLLQCQTVCLGNDWHHVDEFAKLLQDNNVNRLETVTSGLDEVQAAVNAGILDVAFALCRELFVQVGSILIFDVLDDWLPTPVIVHQVAVTWCIDDVEA